MALREFNSVKAKQVSTEIMNKADEVKSVLNNFSNLINENIGNKKVWTGDSARNFKQKFEEAEDEFSNFINVIRNYPSKIDESAKKHEEYESTQY